MCHNLLNLGRVSFSFPHKFGSENIDVIEKYTCYCKNGQNANSAIQLIKINILMLLRSYFIYF